MSDNVEAILTNVEAILTKVIRETVNDTLELAAKLADNYGREGDRIAKEFACETADEIAARIRQLKTE